MATLVKAPSLVGLEEDLTCSICLCVFESPVTTPCGHNFCLPCLDMTWSDFQTNFSCPQCRTCFDSRPELKKNTVLCRVVEQFQDTCAPSKEVSKEKWRSKVDSISIPPSSPIVTCDSCLETAEAAKTCLTCMASFCQEHLRPHFESPAFVAHQLVPLVKELQQRKCSAHSKLLELFCQSHNACICCFCLVSHKTCPIVPLGEAKEAVELQLKKSLTELCALKEKASQSLERVRVQQNQISNTTSRKLDLLKSEFSEIRALIQAAEEDIVEKVMAEGKKVQDKYEYVHKVLGKKKNEVQTESEKTEMVLTEDDEIAFLKKAGKLRQLPFKDVFIPRIDLDENLLCALSQKVFGLKEKVKQSLAQPQERQPREGPQCKPKSLLQIPQPGKFAAPIPKEVNPSKGRDLLLDTQIRKEDVPGRTAEKITGNVAGATATSKDEPKRGRRKHSLSPQRRGRSSSRTERSPATSLDSFLTKSRTELLEFAAKFTLDFNSAHKNITLSDRCTKMSVSEAARSYGSHVHRFTTSSQVVSFQCFKRGIHYWEVELEQNNFCAVGICYGSIPRQGSESRLGRNNSSWCIEWLNGKISAWHNDNEKCLPSNKAKKVGVLLNYDKGFVLFFGVSEKIFLLYKFQAEFTEAVYAAFWLFSSGATMSICQLK